MHLKIRQIQQTCLFELSWGKGQQLTATVAYPDALTILYQDWQRCYLNFYQSALRGRVGAVGQIAAPAVNWHSKLVQAEAQFLSEFHRWLRSAELYEIRAQIANLSPATASNTGTHPHSAAPPLPTDLFLTCEPLSLARLPWEVWELGTEFGAARRVRIVRSPANIRWEPTRSPQRRRPRILVILGDETGLSFAADRQAVQSLSSLADLFFVGWHPGQEAAELKVQICQAIAAAPGWDVLLFAGHSNEAAIVGGELAIAPGVSLAIQDLRPYLMQAKQQGLQFALFNSCSGLNIADTLIDLGLSQVAVMREPIHNQVAQEFLLRFLQALAAFQDTHDALLSACQFLKLDRHLTYPSAALVPSLFRHPDAPSFRLQPPTWQQWLTAWMPTKIEAIALPLLLLLAWLPGISEWLLAQRVLTQAIYRDWTQQIPPSTMPPIAIVQIDDDSIRKRGISDPVPMNRAYLADLVAQLARLDAPVIGIDYQLDRPQVYDVHLQQAIKAAVQQTSAWVILGTTQEKDGQWSPPQPTIAKPQWTLRGDLWIPFWRIRPLPWAPEARPYPFAAWLAIAHAIEHRPDSTSLRPPRPRLQQQGKLELAVMDYLRQRAQLGQPVLPSRMTQNDVAAWSYRYGQRWLQPILDFSIPPQQVYQVIPAWQLLQPDSPLWHSQQPILWRDRIVIIAAGTYRTIADVDTFPLPPAVAYWRDRANPNNQNLGFTGGEAHAYMTYHFANGRAVMPIPDLWMVLLMALLSKGLMVIVKSSLPLKSSQSNRAMLLLCGITAAYGVVTLQLYLSADLLVPWLLPSATAWIYLLPLFTRKTYV